MTDEKKADYLEIEKIKLERLKVYGKIVTVLISVGIGTFGVAYINHIIQNKRLEGQLKQQEMTYLGEFLENALVDNYEKRFRFADYFATLTTSPELQNKWIKYRDGIVQTKEEFDEKNAMLAKVQAKKDKSNEEVEAERKLESEVNVLQMKLLPITRKSDVYITREKAGLRKDGKPRNYKTNKFELKTISNDQVVIDHATGLMWQQSGSDGDMTYKEAEHYIDKLNIEKFAGYNNWRLPTLEEAKSLIEPKENSDGLYIDSRFNSSQLWIWTVDLKNSSRVWIVNFDAGSCGFIGFDYDFYVRAVR